MAATRSINIAQSVTATAAGIALLYFLRGILVPLVLSFALAVLVIALERIIGGRLRILPRWAVVSLAGLTVMVAALATAFIIAQGASQMVRQAPKLIVRMDELIQQALQTIHLGKPVNVATLAGDIDVSHVAGDVLGGVGGFISGLLLMITYFVFILAGWRGAHRKLAHLSRHPGTVNSLEAAVRRIARDIETYLWVQTVTGVIIAVGSALVMFGIGLDNALFWTVVLFLLCYIPMIGVTIGSIVPALFALLQFPTWWQAAAIFAGIQVVAFVVGNLIYPRMQAESQNISPVATLLSLAFWGFLWGITGAFLAVPLTLMVMMICANFPNARWVAVLLSNDGKPSFPKADSTAR